MSDNTIHKGLDWQRTLTFTKTSDKKRQNLTGATIDVVIKRRITDGVPLIALSVGAGVTLADQTPDSATEGQATPFIAGATSDGWIAGNYWMRVSVKPQGEATPQVAMDWTKIRVSD